MNSIGTPDWGALPVPKDDGAAAHLAGLPWPDIGLEGTDGKQWNLSRLKGWSIVFVYPRTGRPGMENPAGWDLIPGARGCTPQSCAFRDQFAELKTAGFGRVFGLSTQITEYQREAAERLHLPFPLLSDAKSEIMRALRLPTFEIEGRLAGEADTDLLHERTILLKRLTLMVRDGVIKHVFYPVFPPDRNADEVLRWMKGQGSRV